MELLKQIRDKIEQDELPASESVHLINSYLNEDINDRIADDYCVTPAI